MKRKRRIVAVQARYTPEEMMQVEAAMKAANCGSLAEFQRVATLDRVAEVLGEPCNDCGVVCQPDELKLVDVGAVKLLLCRDCATPIGGGE